MKNIHVECKPDELLVSKLGFGKKHITHHQGKSRVMSYLQQNENLLALVDEDPLSVAVTSYERSLKFDTEVEGVKRFTDNSGNVVCVLKIKLEDWIIDVCKRHRVDIKQFGLPEKQQLIRRIKSSELELNDLVYKLYSIADDDKLIIER